MTLWKSSVAADVVLIVSLQTSFGHVGGDRLNNLAREIGSTDVGYCSSQEALSRRSEPFQDMV